VGERPGAPRLRGSPLPPALPEGRGSFVKYSGGKAVLYKGVNKAGLCKGAAPAAPTLSACRYRGAAGSLLPPPAAPWPGSTILGCSGVGGGVLLLSPLCHRPRGAKPRPTRAVSPGVRGLTPGRGVNKRRRSPARLGPPRPGWGGTAGPPFALPLGPVPARAPRGLEPAG